MIKIACGLVTYLPDNNVVKRIKSYLKYFDFVFIFDNTPTGEDIINFTDAFKNFKNIRIKKNGINEGLSVAYNYFLKVAKNNFNFICTLDQDSIYNGCNIKNMFLFLKNNNIYQKKIAVIGPLVIYNKKNIKNKCIVRSQKYVISSGSFINLNPNLNLSFDNNYFIDRVDADFCYSCRKSGYSILEYTGSCLFQKLGSKSNYKSITQHNIKRNYYIFRNRFYFNHKFYRHYFLITLLQTSKQCLKIIFFENDKFLKLKQLKLALKDYKMGLMGKGRY